MRRLLRAFQRWFAPGATLPSLPAAPTAPDWNADDRAFWSQFLASKTGQTLLRRGRAIQCETQRTACADVFHTQHSAGAAKGFGECLDWLETLSRTSRVTEDSGPESGQTDTNPNGELEFVN